MCNSVALPKNGDSFPVNHLGKISGVRLVCPKNRLSVTPGVLIDFFVRLDARNAGDFIA